MNSTIPKILILVNGVYTIEIFVATGKYNIFTYINGELDLERCKTFEKKQLRETLHELKYSGYRKVTTN